MRVRFILVFVPIVLLLLFALAVSPYNPNRGGSYREAWPDIAAIWIFLAFFLGVTWALRLRAPDTVTESRVPGLAVLTLSAVAILLGTVGIALASRVTGFPSEYQHLMLWLCMTAGLFLLGIAVLFRDSIIKGFLGNLGYGLSVILGVVSACFVAGLSVMLLVIPSSGVV